MLPEGDPNFGQHMVLRIHRKGAIRVDAKSEILKHLRYRYELSERALVHHAKVAADAMIGKALEIWNDALWLEAASRRLAGDDPDAPPLALGTDIAGVRRRLNAEFPKASDGEPSASEALDSEISDVIDRKMTKHGDDGLLEYLRELPDPLIRIRTTVDVSKSHSLHVTSKSAICTSDGRSSERPASVVTSSVARSGLQRIGAGSSMRRRPLPRSHLSGWCCGSLRPGCDSSLRRYSSTMTTASRASSRRKVSRVLGLRSTGRTKPSGPSVSTSITKSQRRRFGGRLFRSRLTRDADARATN